MNKKGLKRLIEKGESNSVEFKESSSLKDEIGENVSAFSNTNGGVILIGISDLGEIKGAQIGKKTIEEIANFIKQNTDNPVYPKISAETIEDKTIIIIQVEESSEKPVFFKGKAYKRVGNSVHKLSASEIRKLAKESGKKSYWDEQICEGVRLSEIDQEKVKWYLKQREEHRNISKNIKIPINKFLENIKAVRDNKPTNAGILFFGKDPLIRIDVAQLRVIKIKGSFIGGTILDRLDCDGTLWEMVDQAEGFFRKHINFMGFRTGKSFQRDDRFDIPIEALRELIINALIHRDYETTADVRAFIFDDRVEIVNPGTFPKGVTPKNPRHEPVNKILSQYMYDIGFIEKYGSGITNVRHILKTNGNKDLKYVLHKIETKVIVYSQTFLTGVERVTEKVTEKVTENQKEIMKLIRQNKFATVIEIADLIKISRKSVLENISKLKQKGLLKRIGPDKGGYWEVVK